jgi:glycosyltransferase involved in cell wall biosynthesis
MNIVDKVICHTKSTKFWFNYFYPEHKHKILEKILWSAPLVHKKLHKQKSDLKEFENRLIDILFVANKWSRAEKNYEMVKQIIKRCKVVNIHVVGECEGEIEGAVYHQFLTNEQVIGLMKNAKTVVSTSVYDPAPNVLFEASIMGCNVIASQNCGNWELCHPELIVEPYCLENYIKKIHLSLTKRFENNLGYFLQDDPVNLITELINGSKVR